MVSSTKISCAIVGCGNISETYIKNLLRFPIIDLKYCSDLIPDKANEKAEKFNLIPKPYNEILQDESINLVINLTNPSSHFEVSMRAIESGKHIYSEKPLALNFSEAQLLVEKAKQNNVAIGCAPDTFLGSSWQTAKKIITGGWIGKPISATAFMLCSGHESWHPSPEFYYKAGGGPLFDMGPYYLTVLVFLLGPIKEVVGYGKKSYEKRLITSKERFGDVIEVEVLTYITALLKFHNNVICTMIMSFDTLGHNLPYIEIYGETGTLSLPDPNCFSGKIQYYNKYAKKWWEFPSYYDIFENFRGIGIAEMVEGIARNRKFRTSGEIGFHIVEVMEKIIKSAEENKPYTIETNCEPPELMSESDYPIIIPV